MERSNYVEPVAPAASVASDTSAASNSPVASNTPVAPAASVASDTSAASNTPVASAASNTPAASVASDTSAASAASNTPAASTASVASDTSAASNTPAVSTITNLIDLRNWFESIDGIRADTRVKNLLYKINNIINNILEDNHNHRIKGHNPYFHRPPDDTFLQLDGQPIGMHNNYNIGIAENYIKLCRMIDAQHRAGVVQALRKFYIVNSMYRYHGINTNYFDKVILPQIDELIDKYVPDLGEIGTMHLITEFIIVYRVEEFPWYPRDKDKFSNTYTELWDMIRQKDYINIIQGFENFFITYSVYNAKYFNDKILPRIRARVFEFIGISDLSH
jgi:hypothetical protein